MSEAIEASRCHFSRKKRAKGRYRERVESKNIGFFKINFRGLSWII